MNKLARDEGEAVAERIPALRIGTPEDMAGAAIFLASRAGDYVVGATRVVDGGIAWARQNFHRSRRDRRGPVFTRPPGSA